MAVADAGDEALRRRMLIVDAVRFSGFAGAVVSAAVVIWGPLDLAISIMLGTLLGAANFVLLARGVGAAIDRTVAEVERSRREAARLDTEQVVRRSRGAGSALRLLFVVLLLAVVLWYPSTQPLGLAIGIFIVLVAASFAAVRENRQARTSQNAS
jgi:hypothetical protein